MTKFSFVYSTLKFYSVEFNDLGMNINFYFTTSLNLCLISSLLKLSNEPNSLISHEQVFLRQIQFILFDLFPPLY